MTGQQQQQGRGIDLPRVRADLVMTADEEVELAVEMIESDDGTGDDILHFNAAGSSPMPRPVLKRVMKHLALEATLGGYEAEARVQDELEGVYSSIATLLNASGPSEIALMESASAGWTKVFYAIAASLTADDRILTCQVEYAANFVAMLQVASRSGAQIEVVPSTATGEVDAEALDGMLRQGNVKVVCLTHIPSNGGVVNDAERVGEVCRKHGVLYLLDACQSCGQMPLDVQRLHCDALCGTGRKYLRGPRGTGFLYVRSESMERIGEPPMIDHAGAPWVTPHSYQGVAVRYALELGLDNIAERVFSLAKQLRHRLREVEKPHASLDDADVGEEGRGQPRAGGTVVRCMDLGRDDVSRCGIVTFVVEGLPAEDIKQALRRRGVYVTVSAPTSTLLDATARSLEPVVRASVNYFNTEQEIEKFCVVLEEEIHRLWATVVQAGSRS